MQSRLLMIKIIFPIKEKLLRDAQSNAIKRDNFEKIQNEMIIFPYITIKEGSINRENPKIKFSPLIAFDCIKLHSFFVFGRIFDKLKYVLLDF